MMPGVLKERVGDVEVTHANPDMLRMLEKMIDQHGRILDLHAQLVKAFASPPLILHPAVEDKPPEQQP